MRVMTKSYTLMLERIMRIAALPGIDVKMSSKVDGSSSMPRRVACLVSYAFTNSF